MKKSILMLVTAVTLVLLLQSMPVYAQTEDKEALTDTELSGTDTVAADSTDETLTAVSGVAVAMGGEMEAVSGSAVGETDAVSGAAVDAEAAAKDEAQTAAAKDEEKETKEDKEDTEDTEKTTVKKTVKKKSYTNGELKLLACLIYSEAGNQSYKGKLAVANVVLNRVKSDLFPGTMKEVIYQKAYSRSYGRTIYQFSVASPSVGTLKKAWNVYGKRTNAAEIKAEEECIKAAKAALEGKSAFDGKNYLFFCRYTSSLASRKTNGVKIGAHYFYR